MTYEERKKQVCKDCHNRIGCAYLSREIADKCTYLQSIMEGWELGQEDTINKSCEWIKNNARKYFDVDYIQHEWYFESGKMIKDFRKAMED